MSSHSQAIPIVEETQNPDYDPKKFYPARIGETLHSKYCLISKLGFGSGSTVWLAKDVSRWRWQSNKYVAIKITNSKPEDRTAARNEIQIHRQISQVHSSHEGQNFVRQLEESFEIKGPFGSHDCLVFEPLRESIWMLGRRFGPIGLPPPLAKAFLKVILTSLDYLHTECHVIHTDLKADNFILAFEDSAVLEDYVQEQDRNPASFTEIDGRPIYESRPDFGPLRKGVGRLKTIDFGTAVSGGVLKPHNHDIQPLQFSAPEVILRATWTYSTDIWNLGTMLWEIFTEAPPFSGCGPGSTTYSVEAHLAQMIRLLGPPPPELLSRGDPAIVSRLFSKEGEFKYPHLIPPDGYGLSSITPFLEGEDKRLFLEFAKRMLKWLPEQRATAAELIEDPWLTFNLKI
ncbi:hypothetical protein LOZ12_004359 [Ophidiomyces ophidiicola]|uniref:Uncharacterized protein n=1 Tax=Ophidiomyces ophidiicola TaxID=1387563 RepID=A0ACB8UVW0_9EURO|nr:hypothetical protein LOZ64_005365 [Ophidiomyces ophidiicola]KAI1943253.1 hypothetical protein LOZ62_004335 [Ophidiomyces ophidiicola]KAI2003883.1 hypothetical protein LOZ50_004628 [Ophidiomyces ophidiicola]KAI2029232.1 hypothetical protein LOZ47_006784 [Ophidiomyces ophidiicola]KAI2033490.1 hypothetical protein LOZ45_000774 [Ophidiomyces ophidiicola]